VHNKYVVLATGINMVIDIFVAKDDEEAKKIAIRNNLEEGDTDGEEKIEVYRLERVK